MFIRFVSKCKFVNFVSFSQTFQDFDVDESASSAASEDAFLRIAIPNEQEGCIEYHTFPILPQMNVAKLCRGIAHQFAITSPEDYGL